jgi:hypothetical protein
MFSAWLPAKNVLPFKQYFDKYSKTKDVELQDAIEEATEELGDEKVTCCVVLDVLIVES